MINSEIIKIRTGKSSERCLFPISPLNFSLDLPVPLSSYNSRRKESGCFNAFDAVTLRISRSLSVVKSVAKRSFVDLASLDRSEKSKVTTGSAGRIAETLTTTTIRSTGGENSLDREFDSAVIEIVSSLHISSMNRI